MSMRIRTKAHARVLAAALGWIAIGCGSGGSAASDGPPGGTGSCTSIGTPGASMSWDDDRVFVCAVAVGVTEDSTATLDLVDVTGSTATLGVSFGVSTPGTPIAGPYTCATSTASQVTFNYQQGSTPTFATSCAITIDSSTADGGTRVTGTFSGLFGTKMITNGVYSANATVVANP